MTETELPRPLQNLLTTSVAHALRLLPVGTPFPPFVVVDDGDRLTLRRFQTDDLAQSQEAARAWLREQQGLRYACVVWDATLTTGDGPVDVICADGSDASGADGWVVAQRYGRSEAEQGWAASGEPVVLKRSTPVLGG